MQIGSNKLKKLCRETYIINNLNGKKTVRTFSEKNYKKQIKKQFRIQKLIKRKSEKLYVK